MARTNTFTSQMAGQPAAELRIYGPTVGNHIYNPYGSDTEVYIPAGGSVQSVLIDSPVQMDAISIERYDEGTTGQAKYIRCMELLGNGQIPVCTARNLGPAGTHGCFGTLAYITDDCELCFHFPVYRTLGGSSMIYKLTSAGVWYKVE